MKKQKKSGEHIFNFQCSEVSLGVATGEVLQAGRAGLEPAPPSFSESNMAPLEHHHLVSASLQPCLGPQISPEWPGPFCSTLVGNVPEGR